MNRNARLVSVLVIALVAATVASFAVYRALSANAGGPKTPQTVDTIVAAQPIAAGTLVTRAHIKVVQWPANARLAESISNPADVVDRGAIVAIALNEPITPSKLAAAGAGAGLPPTIPPGMRAISVRVNEVVGVAGYVLPGNRVDVVATASPTESRSDTTSKVVLTNVQVLTAGTRMEQDNDQNKPVQVTVVTLLVTPEQAERLALASTEGKIQLALRNPLDTGAPVTPGIRTAGLLGGKPAEGPKQVARSTRPRQAQPQTAPAPVSEPRPSVEIIRGDKRSVEVIK